MDIREQCIEYVGRAIQRKRLSNVQKIKEFIDSPFYSQLVEDKEYDTLLSIYIKMTGLNFALICEGMERWRQDTNQSNEPWNVALWNRRIMDWHNKPPFPDDKPKDKVTNFIQELNDLKQYSEGK